MRKIILFIFLSLNLSYAQNLHVITEGGFTLGSNNTPFLLRANRYGLVPNESQVMFLNGKLYKEYDSTGKAWGLGYGVETHLNVGNVNQILLPQAYVKARWKSLELYAGRRKEIVGLVDTMLTSGSYIWSGNALPMPKVQIGMPEYTPIMKNGLISIKAAFAHGWFDNNRPVTSNVKLHQKWLYARIGKPSWKIKIFAGANHNAQWGGNSPFYTVNGKLPDGFKNFMHVAFGTRGAITGAMEISDYDANRIGNHLGTIDIGLDLDLDNVKFFVYRQNIFEDGSLFFLANVTDGLNGVSLSFKKGRVVRVINFEYLNTKSQGGDFFQLGDGLPGELRGRDNYFNNGQYSDGWTYKEYTLGTPMINSGLDWTNPKYILSNNRVEMFQWSISGYLPFNANYILKGNHNSNLGTYDTPFNKKKIQTSLLLSSIWSKNKNIFMADIGYDFGSLYTSNIGLQFGWKRYWR